MPLRRQSPNGEDSLLLQICFSILQSLFILSKPRFPN